MSATRRDLVDANAIAAGLLQDMAAVQTSKEKTSAYRRAADAIFNLDAQLPDLVSATGTLPKFPSVGPSSARVLVEFLEHGRSAIVDAAVLASTKADDIARRRATRDTYFSRAGIRHILASEPKAGLPLRGDLQVHSTGSDGTASLEELATAAVGRGYEYLAVTDHSRGLAIAGGMTMAAFAAQHAAIDRINQTCEGRFRLLKGVEANIGADGTLDLDESERRQFDLVLAAPHAQLRGPEDQTARMLRAVQQAGVHVLAHPRGRHFGTRTGIVADWPRVFAAAAAHQVAVELDGDPHRQDLDCTLARVALDAGCLFAMSSDAHSIAELGYTENSRAHAVLAHIPAARVINCWKVDRLVTWLARGRGPGRSS